jgi:hypothetical protein
MPALNLFDVVKWKEWRSPLAIAVCTSWLTWQIADLRAVLEHKIDQAWTVHMQAVWAEQTAMHNVTNWVPNPYEIYFQVRAGQHPDPVTARSIR